MESENMVDLERNFASDLIKTLAKTQADVKRLTKQMQEVRWLVGWIIKELASEANKKQVAFDKVYQVYQCSQVQRKRLQRL
jgi:hypothetical protein